MLVQQVKAHDDNEGNERADALTKMASADVISKLRACTDGQLPPMPGATFAIKDTDDCWWSLMVIFRGCGWWSEEVTGGG